MLDEAVEHFRGAGCAEADIRGALKNHYRAADLDQGPDPEPEKVPFHLWGFFFTLWSPRAGSANIPQ